MNTRDKIVDLPPAVPAILVIGAFDPLLAAHSERLQQLAQPGVKLVAAVSEIPNALLPLQARRELVAACRAVDFVVPLEPGLQAEFPWLAVHDDTTLHHRWATNFHEHVRSRNR